MTLWLDISSAGNSSVDQLNEVVCSLGSVDSFPFLSFNMYFGALERKRMKPSAGWDTHTTTLTIKRVIR